MNEIITKQNAQLARLQSLVETAQDLADNSVSDRTKTAYTKDFEHFQKWTDNNSLASLPAKPETVALYIADLAENEGLKVSTISRRLVAISQMHQVAGYENPPTKDAKVRAVMKGIKNKHGVKPERKKGITTTQIKQWINTLQDIPQDVRDKAIILLGYAGAFRRSEIVSLDVKHINFVEQGMIISLERSKTNQEGDSEDIGIPYGQNPNTCPVIALRQWLDLAKIKDGPAFRRIRRGGHVKNERLSSKSVALIVKRLCKDLGLSENDCLEYAGHSLRAGHVTQATNNGSPRHITKKQTRHKSDKVFDGYYREGNLFRENSASHLEL